MHAFSKNKKAVLKQKLKEQKVSPQTDEMETNQAQEEQNGQDHKAVAKDNITQNKKRSRDDHHGQNGVAPKPNNTNNNNNKKGNVAPPKDNKPKASENPNVTNQKKKKTEAAKDVSQAVAEEPINEDDEEEEFEEEEEEETTQNANDNKTKNNNEIPPTLPSGDFTLTEKTFADLPICERSRDSIKEMGFTHLTEIQSRSIEPLLEGKDLLGQAKTGSGKTLAFLIPAVELLWKHRFSPKKGTGILVLSPTRELALQIYGIAHELLKYHTFTHGLVIGGANRKSEADKLIRGVNLLIATPGRLLDHMQNTRGFNYDNLKCLIIDETDRILDVGFEEDLREIVKRLPKPRQTMLFSATQTQKVEDIARLSLRDAPVIVTIEDKIKTVANLEQGYVVCPSDVRFTLLFNFLKRNQNKKVIVFFSSCNSVTYHGDLFTFIGVPVTYLHGKLSQNKRTATFFEFVNAPSGILFCTDVAARGLDIPKVDWIVQFDPPDDPREYIHRVGRTARAGNFGKALLFLLPEELTFLKYLKQAGIPLNEYEFPQSKVSNIHDQLTKLISKNYYLNKACIEAYKSYLNAYASHAHKDIFNVFSLDLVKVAKAFGLEAPPKVNLSIAKDGKNLKKKRPKMKFVKH